MSPSEPVGTIRALWRFPVKSMLGEELEAVDLDEGGVVGDRAYAIVDRETGKVASAKHPKLWPNLLSCRATFVEPPLPGDEVRRSSTSGGSPPQSQPARSLTSIHSASSRRQVSTGSANSNQRAASMHGASA